MDDAGELGAIRAEPGKELFTIHDLPEVEALVFGALIEDVRAIDGDDGQTAPIGGLYDPGADEAGGTGNDQGSSHVCAKYGLRLRSQAVSSPPLGEFCLLVGRAPVARALRSPDTTRTPVSKGIPSNIRLACGRVTPLEDPGH